MPRITFRGLDIYIPGVYVATDVVSNLPGASRAFQVPVLLAGADQGYPYTVQDDVYPHEGTVYPWRRMDRSANVRTFYNKGSDMDVAYGWAKKGGLPYAWCVCLSALTRASVIATSTGPVNQLTIYGKLFGTPGGWHKITWTGGVFTVTPWKHWTRLTVNAASGDYRVYVADNSWAYEGMVVEIGDNDTANAEKTIAAKGQEIGDDGQVLYWIEFSATVGASITTAQYGAVAFYKEADAEVSDTLTTGQDIIDFLENESDYLGAVRHANYTGAAPAAVATATPLKDISAWGTVTDGTSPAPTATDVEDFLAQLDAGQLDAWRASADALPRVFCLALDDSSAHATAATWAAEQRADGYPVLFVTGVGWGDTVIGAGDNTAPEFRTAALDSQDMALCVMGLNRLPSYLSLAPYVWGYIASGGVNHNLTKDRILASHFETRWSKADLETLIRAGVITLRQFVTASAIYQGIAQGLNTLQANATAWNAGTNGTTPLINQRDIADFIALDLRLSITDKLLGEDSVSKSDVTGAALARGRIYEAQGYIEAGSFKVVSIALNSAGNGWDVEACFKPITTVDFITITATILVGEDEES